MTDLSNRKLNRRALLGATGVAGVLAVIGLTWRPSVSATAGAAGKFEVEKTDAEWRRILTPDQYAVLRGHGTERAWSSPLEHEKRKGTYYCAGCDLALYSSETKFDSGTGWPSFWKPLPNAIGLSNDGSVFMGIEVHCRRCGGHLGHVFEDGPAPTGQRYCMDGVALTFKPV